MGLDIRAYSQLTPFGMHVADVSDCDVDGHVRAFAYDVFPQSFRGVPVLGHTRGVLMGGCFGTTTLTKTYAFRAGSYGGYGVWRQNLDDQFGSFRDTRAPFHELVNFADNEGCIGPEAAQSLAEDFRAYAHLYRPYVEDGDPYWDFMAACELASDAGLIVFH